MITINTYSQKNGSEFLDSIWKENSLLIIGSGENGYLLNEIYKPKNESDVYKCYGDSDLSFAYSDAVKYGATNIFVMNCHKTTDFVKGIIHSCNYNFSYISIVGIKLSDTFYSEAYDKIMHYAELCLREGIKTNSVFVFTDEHASLYENIDAFIDDMTNKTVRFKSVNSGILEYRGTNIIFCANSLEDSKYANVVTASRIVSSNVSEYPEPISDVSVFDFDFDDFLIQEICYFKNNILTGTSIENLYNFKKESDAAKVVVIDRVIKYIEKKIDLSDIMGKLYSKYLEMTLYDKVDDFLRKLLNEIILDYSIEEIRFIPDENMTGRLEVIIVITPYNSLEEVSLLLEVS